MTIQTENKSAVTMEARKCWENVIKKVYIQKSTKNCTSNKIIIWEWEQNNWIIKWKQTDSSINRS